MSHYFLHDLRLCFFVHLFLSLLVPCSFTHLVLILVSLSPGSFWLTIILFLRLLSLLLPLFSCFPDLLNFCYMLLFLLICLFGLFLFLFFLLFLTLLPLRSVTPLFLLLIFWILFLVLIFLFPFVSLCSFPFSSFYSSCKHQNSTIFCKT